MSKLSLIFVCVAAVIAVKIPWLDLEIEPQQLALNSCACDKPSCTLCTVEQRNWYSGRQHPVTATSGVQLPAVYPLVNILLPLLNNVYNLLLSLLSIFDTLPANISCMIPVDLGALETSLLKLYSQALAIVNFLRGLPEYAVGANPNSPPANIINLQELLTALISLVTELTDDVLIGIGGALLPGLLKLVVMVVKALLCLLL